VGKPQKSVKWKIVGSYTGGQVRWFLASKVESGDATVTTEDTGQLTMGQETIHQEGMGGLNHSRPEGTFDRLVYNDAYFANTRALWNEHPYVLANLLGVKNRPMTEIVTVEEDLGISTMTNRSGETALVKRRRVDGCEEEVDDSELVRTEQSGRGNKSISSTTGEEESQPGGGGGNSAVDEDPDESDNTALLEALEQEEANEQERKENVGEERTTAKSAVDETMQDRLRFFCDSLDERMTRTVISVLSKACISDGEGVCYHWMIGMDKEGKDLERQYKFITSTMADWVDESYAKKKCALCRATHILSKEFPFYYFHGCYNMKMCADLFVLHKGTTSYKRV
jgi:hypothetical protein